MAVDIFNLAAQSFVGGALNAVGRNIANNLTSSATNALGGSLMGGNVASGLIMGTGMVPDIPCGSGSAGCSGYGSGIGSLNDPCGQFNTSFNNAFGSMAIQGAAGSIGQLGLLAATGNLNGFGDNLLDNASNIGTNLSLGIMGNLGASAVDSLISTVGNASLSDAGSWLDSAADAISDWF